jgi:hypothetical protein
MIAMGARAYLKFAQKRLGQKTSHKITRMIGTLLANLSGGKFNNAVLDYFFIYRE